MLTLGQAFCLFRSVCDLYTLSREAVNYNQNIFSYGIYAPFSTPYNNSLRLYLQFYFFKNIVPSLAIKIFFMHSITVIEITFHDDKF
jgi:hypothetical protein